MDTMGQKERCFREKGGGGGIKEEGGDGWCGQGRFS